VDCPVTYDDITEDSLALARVVDCAVGVGPSGSFGEIHSGRLELEGPFLPNVKREDIIALIRDQDIAEPPPKSNDVQEWYRQIMEYISNQPQNKQGQGDNSAEAEKKWEDSVPEDGDIAVLVTFSRDWRVVHEQRVEGVVYSGLLLRRKKTLGGGAEDGGDKYERIGAFVNESRGWLDQSQNQNQKTGVWERRTVVLV
jgi:hypothetical protein